MRSKKKSNPKVENRNDVVDTPHEAAGETSTAAAVTMTAMSMVAATAAVVMVMVVVIPKLMVVGLMLRTAMCLFVGATIQNIHNNAQSQRVHGMA